MTILMSQLCQQKQQIYLYYVKPESRRQWNYLLRLDGEYLHHSAKCDYLSTTV